MLILRNQPPNSSFGMGTEIIDKKRDEADGGRADARHLMAAWKEPQLSFGGIKASGFGIPEAGNTGIEFFTEHQVAYVGFRS